MSLVFCVHFCRICICCWCVASCGLLLLVPFCFCFDGGPALFPAEFVHVLCHLPGVVVGLLSHHSITFDFSWASSSMALLICSVILISSFFQGWFLF